MICCVIPTSNASVEQLTRTVEAMLASTNFVQVVINDADPIRRASVRRACTRLGAGIEEYPYYLGKAEALRRGLASVLSIGSFETVLQIDANLKIDLTDMSRFAEELNGRRRTLLLGDRYGETLPVNSHRMALVQLMSQLMELTTGLKVRDTVCGARAYSVDLAEIYSSRSASYGYGIEAEQLILSRQAGGTVESIQVGSQMQANMTASRKLLDNFAVILWYGRKHLPAVDYGHLSFLASAIARDADFAIPAGAFNLPGTLEFQFHRSGEDDERSYAVSFAKFPDAVSYSSRR